MHFSKTYDQLLLTLPDELRTSAIEYRQLKKLIHVLVAELDGLGLSPHVLHALRAASPDAAVYEPADADAGVPRLRLRVDADDAPRLGPDLLWRIAHPTPLDIDDAPQLGPDLLWRLEHPAPAPVPASVPVPASESLPAPTPTPAPIPTRPATPSHSAAVLVPLPADAAFFRLLAAAPAALHTALAHTTAAIPQLAAAVAQCARPASARGASDLAAWRAVLRAYAEAQVFAGTAERDRGAHGVEEAEARLALFARRVGEGGAEVHMAMARSRAALQWFLELNVHILNLKKFERANAEAARKILKKHAKRTALPPAPPPPALALSHMAPHVLVVLLTETLMPVVPHLDDYSCLICTALAYTPIRLGCGHLFCVRCLVKMQRRGQDRCPMCRAQTVVVADKSNVDHALINFMRDWFPAETKAKAKENERESAQEEMEAMGLDTRCVVM